MAPLQFLVPIGRLETVAPVLPWAALVLALANVGTRYLAHQHHAAAVADADGDETVGRYRPHLLSSALLVVVSFLFLIVEPHGGMVLSVLVLGTVIADLFEFEARQVEARNDLPLERPKGALTGSALVVLYAAFQALFVYVAPVWNAVV